jgi:hypothetical protein
MEMPRAAMAARVCASIKAPPPVASTIGPPLSSRRITRCSPARKCGSPWRAKISAIEMPAARSISVSASTKGRRSASARRRPMAVLPAPIRPTSTRLRGTWVKNSRLILMGFRD